MLSRVADNLYWMSRYLERAEHTARLVDVHLNLMLEQPDEESQGRWQLVRRMLGVEAEAGDGSAFVKSLCFDRENRSSIVACITSARDNARQVREQISSEMWLELNRLFHEVRRAEHGEAWESEPMDFVRAVIAGAHLFEGLTSSTMSHGEGWQFIQLGRFLERAQTLAKLVDGHFTEFTEERRWRPDAGPDAADYLEWIGVLRCATAFEAYCKVYTAQIDPHWVAEFLVLNEEFPHSLRFSVDQVESSMAALAKASPSRRGQNVQRRTGRLKAALSFAQADEMMASGLHHFLEDIFKQCAQIHTGVYRAYLSYSIEAALEA